MSVRQTKKQKMNTACGGIINVLIAHLHDDGYRFFFSLFLFHLEYFCSHVNNNENVKGKIGTSERIKKQTADFKKKVRKKKE